MKTEEVPRNPTGNIESAEVFGLQSSFNYSITVQAVNNQGKSTESGQYYQVTLNPSAPSVPNAPIVTAASYN